MPSTQYCFAAGTASASIAPWRPGLAGLDDRDLPPPARFGSGGEAGDDLAVASGGVCGLLALEISEKSRATENRSRPARSHPADEQRKSVVGPHLGSMASC